MPTKHAVKRSVTSDAFFGIRLLLQFLCLTLPVLENAKQICSAISNSVYSVFAECSLMLARQEEFIALQGLQRLLFINLIMLTVYLVAIGMVTTLCIADIVIYVCNFYFLRHRRILWIGLLTSLQLAATCTLLLLQCDESLFALVRLAMFAIAYILTKIL